MPKYTGKRYSGKRLGRQPLPGVNVVVKGTTNGGITDLDGNFTLYIMPTQHFLLPIFVFKSQEVAVNGKNSLKIVLQEDSETLDEVVVVGCGVQKKSMVTASIAKFSSETGKQISGAYG